MSSPPVLQSALSLAAHGADSPLCSAPCRGHALALCLPAPGLCLVLPLPGTSPLSTLVSTCTIGSAQMTRPGQLSLTSASLANCTVARAEGAHPPALWGRGHVALALAEGPDLVPSQERGTSQCVRPSLCGRAGCRVAVPRPLLPDRKETCVRWPLPASRLPPAAGRVSVAPTGCRVSESLRN